MPSPSFVKRLRNNTGNTVTFTTNGSKKRQTVRVERVVFDKEYKDYVLVGRDVSNIARRGAPSVVIATDTIDRPVKYSTTTTR